MVAVTHALGDSRPAHEGRMIAISSPEVSRRTFVGTLGGGPGGAPLAAEAQQAGKVWRIGVLSPGPPTRTGSSELLRQSLRELGYVEGLNLAIEWRDAEGKTERFDHLAAELVRLKVDVIVATVPGATLAAKRSTASIPVVMVNTPDPVQLALVASLHPRGRDATVTTSLRAGVSP